MSFTSLNSATPKIKQTITREYNNGKSMRKIEKDYNETEFFVDLPNIRFDKLLILRCNNLRCTIYDINDYCAF